MRVNGIPKNILINLSKKDKNDEEWWPRLAQSKS